MDLYIHSSCAIPLGTAPIQHCITITTHVQSYMYVLYRYVKLTTRVYEHVSIHMTRRRTQQRRKPCIFLGSEHTSMSCMYDMENTRAVRFHITSCRARLDMCPATAFRIDHDKFRQTAYGRPAGRQINQIIRRIIIILYSIDSLTFFHCMCFCSCNSFQILLDTLVFTIVVSGIQYSIVILT